MASLEQSFEHFWHLDEDAFRRQVNSYNEEQLTALHASMSRKIVSAGASAGASVGGAFFTGGVSLLFTPIAARRYHVNAQRLDIIEARLKMKGWSGYRMKKRDFVIPVAAASVGLGVGIGADAVLSHVAADAAGAAAIHGVDAARVTAENSAAFVHGAEYGALNQVSEVATAAGLGATHYVTHQAAMHAVQHVPFNDILANEAANFGAHCGHAAAQAAESDILKAGVMKAVEVGTERTLSSRDNTITKEREETERRRIVEEKEAAARKAKQEAEDEKRLQDIQNNEQCLRAIRGGTATVVQNFVDKGYDIENPNQDGYTALLQAVAADNLAVVRFLVRKGADVHRANNFGSTALLIAMKGDNIDLIRTLIQHGADPDVSNRYGETARSIARTPGKQAFLDALDKKDNANNAPTIVVRAESINDNTTCAYWAHYYSQSRWKRWPKKIFCCYGCT